MMTMGRAGPSHVFAKAFTVLIHPWEGNFPVNLHWTYFQNLQTLLVVDVVALFQNQTWNHLSSDYYQHSKQALIEI